MMDPNATLQIIRAKSAEVVALRDSHNADSPETLLAISELADELAAAVQALDSWIDRGGFLPTAWAPSTRILTKGGRA